MMIWNQKVTNYIIPKTFGEELRIISDAFLQMACSTVRYGPGVTQEVGQDLEAMGAKKVLVMTDKILAGLKPVATVVDSLTRNNVNFSVFDNVRIEPTDSRFVTQDKTNNLIMHAESFYL